MHKTLDPIWVCGAGAYAAPQGKDFPPHHHTVWELVYYRTGSPLCPIGDVVHEAQPGTLLLTPPFVVHAERARTAYSNFYISVQADADQPWPRVCQDDADRTLGNLCRALVREMGGKTPDAGEMVALLLAQLDLLLRRLRAQGQMSEPERLVARAEAFLEEHLAEAITIEDAAREAGVAASTLRAHFAQTRGTTPLAHLHDVRLRHALALLQNSNLTLESVAHQCGYYSASHLSRHVKRETGKSPGQMRG